VRPPESIESFPDDHAVEYLINIVGRGRDVYVADRHQRRGRWALADVGGDAAGDDVQVRADAGLVGVEPACRAPQPHERLLNHLLGQASVTELVYPEAIELLPYLRYSLATGARTSPAAIWATKLASSAGQSAASVTDTVSPPTRFLRRLSAERFSGSRCF
jgi:hypothetical protein